MEHILRIEKGNPLPLGVSVEELSINFSIALPNEEKCNLVLYIHGDIKPLQVIEIKKEYKTGSIFSVKIFGLEKYLIDKALIENTKDDQGNSFRKLEYMYEVRGSEFIDPYAIYVTGREQWGAYTTETGRRVRGAIYLEKFNWEDDKQPRIQYKDMILYRLHVRGFTKHISSKVKHKGTYLGIVEKIPYMKELGINAIELMPITEFEEIIPMKDPAFYMKERYRDYDKLKVQYKEKKRPNEVDERSYKINYWGYTENRNYFAPKVSYAWDKNNPIGELKQVIKTLHKEGIEVILEINFARGTNQSMIIECLRYWVQEYHIDGFKINDDVIPTTFIATDPILGDTKFFANNWNDNEIYGREHIPRRKTLGEYNDGFMVDARRLLKGDEGQVSNFIYRFRKNPKREGVVNYITNTNGFTLMDLVSYDIKHNDANGENNKDGTEYNYSWNCGVEGKTRRKKVVGLRQQQIRNAFLLLLMSQGTPMILAGDEFGQTQGGNNNPYCQDNETTWLNWNLLNTNLEILEYVKSLINLRKAHPILHMEEELRNMDYISCGYPDLSFHGTKAWYLDTSIYSRVFGVMLCGKYMKVDRKNDDDFFYIAYNMHWEDHEYDLPKLPTKMQWYKLIDTFMTPATFDSNLKIGGIIDKGAKEERLLLNQRMLKVKARSIILCIGKEIG